MRGAGVHRAHPALFILVLLLGTTGCAGVPRGAARASAARAVPSGHTESREPHLELELVSVHHTVVAGDTLYRIARAYGLRVEELAAVNGIRDAKDLVVGQELLIPGSERPTPVARDAPPEPEGDPARTGGKPGAGTKSALAAPGRPSPAAPARPVPARPVPETKGTLDWPLRGVLYARFGKKGREPHDGIDLAVPVGTPVKTAQEGEVLYAGEQRGYGLIVIVQHSDRLITLYAHNRDLRVKTGQKVRREQVIATVGESGKTSGPQLHFEVRVDGKPVDPLDYLGPLPSS